MDTPILVRPGNPFVTLPLLRELGSIAIAGDWHGDESVAIQQLYRAAGEGAACVIQLGDFGLFKSFATDRYLKAISEVATELKLPVFWLDGNHEDFLWIKSTPIDPKTGLQIFAKNLYRLPRGARWSWGGVNFMVVGGATSLDKPYRKEGISWWPEEELTREQIDELIRQTREYGKVDVLFTHDAPFGVDVPGIGHRDYSNMWSAVELERAWDHRELLAELVREVSPLAIFHGHFHKRYSSATDAFGVKTEVVGLSDNNELRMNVTFRELSSFATHSS